MLGFNDWLALHEEDLKETWLEDNQDLGLLDDDYADICNRQDFQEWLDTQYLIYKDSFKGI